MPTAVQHDLHLGRVVEAGQRDRKDGTREGAVVRSRFPFADPAQVVVLRHLLLPGSLCLGLGRGSAGQPMKLYLDNSVHGGRAAGIGYRGRC